MNAGQNLGQNAGGHFDVIIVGAGLSGIGAAYHLQTKARSRTYAILEARANLGGTWDLFRYPGVRSDSDMHTLGYNFKPWTSRKSIADGPAILQYVTDTSREHGIDRHIQYNQKMLQATWSSETARWTVTTQHQTGQPQDAASTAGSNATTTFTCNFLHLCSGYYNYAGGHTPAFAVSEQFSGTIVHPQAWPEDLDYANKRIVVIGSGATAMTLVPAMAKTAAHVTMLQRSPTYVVSRPDTDAVANALRKVLPNKVAYQITRSKNVTMQQFFYRQTRTKPEQVKANLLKRVNKQLGADYDVDTHFTPSYNPWDQRLCLVPNNDLFGAIRSGKATVVTDTIESFTETGIKLASGDHLEADIIVTATGLELVAPADATFVVDGKAVDLAETWSYKGFAFSDVPNLAFTFGYINASWTLRADLIAEYICRMLNHMQTTATAICTPRLRAIDQNMPPRPWIDGFPAGYMQRGLHLFPKQGDHEPWINPQDYGRDKAMFRKSDIDDGVMCFEPAMSTRAAER